MNVADSEWNVISYQICEHQKNLKFFRVKKSALA